MPIQRAKVDVKDDLACIGYVDAVEEVKLTQPNSEEQSDYAMFRVIIKGNRGSRGGRLNFLFRPEWLQGYNPDELKAYTPPPKKDGTERKEGSMYTVYRNHVGGVVNAKGETTKPSLLEGMCGSTEAFNELQVLIDAAQATKGAFLDEKECHAIIKDFLLKQANEGVMFGYILRQAKEKNGDLTDNYDVDQIVFNSEKQRQAWERKAAQSARAHTAGTRGFRIAYEPY